MHQNTFREIESRINTLASEYDKLQSLNDLILKHDTNIPKIDLDPASGKLKIELKGVITELFIRKKDEDVPVSIRDKSLLTSFLPEGDTPDSQNIDKLKNSLGPALEAFYYSANKLIDLVESLPNVSKFSFIGVKMVRNKLIEHPPDGSLYSFGASTSGPVIKPVKIITYNWNDKGLTSNALELVEHVEKKLAASKAV